MAVENEKELIRAYLLIRVADINEDNWEYITARIFDLRNKYPGVIRADWVEGDNSLIVPVVAKDDEELGEIKCQIVRLTFSPNNVKELKEVKVKGHNPPPPPEDPLRDNEWG
jgi:hypothetical protein